MDDITIARTIHVVSVVHWIGGVAFVTLVLLPAVRRLAEPAQRVALFEEIESRFAMQARVSTLAAGLSGFWMTARLDAWDRFADARFWWMHAMVALWSVFTLMLFVLEPLVLHRLFQQRAAAEPVATFALIQRLHYVLLAASAVVVAAAVLGAHGWL
ncbi:MAG: hypothetical protein IT538_06985 [Variibacter sp.]|nr:hypothetical protein [Variibacter sp.]